MIEFKNVTKIYPGNNVAMDVVDRDKTLVGLVTRASVVEEIYNNLWQDYEPEDESKLDYTV